MEKCIYQWIIDTCALQSMNGWHMYYYVFTSAKYTNEYQNKEAINGYGESKINLISHN